MDEHLGEDDGYAGYNAFGRVAVMFGIPIIPFLVMAVLILASGFIGATNFGAIGLLPSTMLLVILLVMRVQCLDNPRALGAMRWHLKGIILRLQCGSSIVSFTAMSTPQKRRNAHVKEWFKHRSNSR